MHIRPLFMAPDQPKISIITVVLNAAGELERTVHSVLGQEYPHLEFIVIDGGSTDGTLEVIKTLGKKIDHWTSGPDRGIYDAMNKGLAIATGEWINFMNAGDVFTGKDAVSKAMSGDLEGFGVVYGDSIADYPHAQVLRRAGMAEDMIRGMVFCHQAAFVRRELATVKGFDLSFPVGADFDMMIRLFSSGVRFLHLPFPVAVIDVSGVSNRKMVQSAREHFAISMKYRKLKLADRIYHWAYIGWVSLVSIAYRIFPVGAMHFLSNLGNKSNKVNHQNADITN